jgi:hypothetical protein
MARVISCHIALALATILGVSLLLEVKSVEAQTNLLPPDQVGAQSTPDLTFSEITPPGLNSSDARHVDRSNPNAQDDLFHGSAAKPWKTIGFAAAHLEPGQVAYIHSGAYSEDGIATVNAGLAPANGNPAKPIWLMPVPGEHVVIQTPENSFAHDPFIRVADPYWIIQGFEIHATGSFDPADPFAPAVVVQQTDHVVVKNIDAHHGSGPEAVLFNDAKNVALLNNQIHEYQEWFRPGASKPEDSHGALVTGTSDRVLLSGNHSWGNSGDSVQCQPGYQADGITPDPARTPTNITIKANDYHADRENAVDVKTCKNVTVSGNELHGYRPSPVACPGNCSPTGDAIVVHFEADKVLIEQNWIYDSGRAASIGGDNFSIGTTPVIAEAGSVVFRRNLVRDMVTTSPQPGITGAPGAGVRTGPASEVEVYHNTFHNLPGTAIRVGESSLRSGATQQADVINNIVVSAGIGLSTGNAVNLAQGQNLFWNTPQGIPPGSITADPMFMSDYYTKRGSPARDVALGDPIAVDPGSALVCGSGSDIGRRESCDPTITRPAPSPGSEIRDRTPLIAATVRDADGQLAKSNIKLWVDGQAKSFTYNADTDRLSHLSGTLAYSGHTVKIEITDASDLKAGKTWIFKVVRS